MLKMALLECANSDNCCSVHPAHPFLSHCWLLGIWQLKCPCPQEFAIQGKKKVLMSGEVGGGGGGGGGGLGIAGIDWCINIASI